MSGVPYRVCASPTSAIVLALLTPLLCVGSAEGATRTWDGSASTAWNNALNWVEGAIPVNGDDVVFDHTVLGGAYTVDVNDTSPNLLNSITIDTRGASPGNITFTINNDLLCSGNLSASMNAGQTVAFNHGGGNERIRVDGALVLGAAGTGGAVTFGTASATVNLLYDFDLGAADATITVGANVTVTLRLMQTDDVSASWLDLAAGSTFELQTENLVGANDHYFRLTAEEGGAGGKAISMVPGSTINLNNQGTDDIADMTIELDGSTCTFGDGDGTPDEVCTISGSGDFVVLGTCTLQGTGATLDSLTLSANLWLQLTFDLDELSIADDLDVSFLGGAFHQLYGSLRCGTTAGNDGTVIIAGTSRGFTACFIPVDDVTLDATITNTVNGAGTLTYQSPVVIWGNSSNASGPKGRIVANDTATVNLGNDSGDFVDIWADDDTSAPTSGAGEIILNGSAVLNTTGIVTLISQRVSGAKITINDSAVMTVGTVGTPRDLNVNLTATSSHDGGIVTVGNGVASLARLFVTGNLVVQGNSTGTTTPGKVIVNSPRTSTPALEVGGTTTLTGGTVSRGTIDFQIDGLGLFTGAVSIGSNSDFDVSDTSGAGPEVRFDGNVTANGSWDPGAAGAWTCVLRGSGAQTFGGTAAAVSFNKLRFEATAARTISFSNSDTIYSVSGAMTSGGSPVTVDATAARTFQVSGGCTFDATTTFSTNTTVTLGGAVAQTIGGTAATGPTFLNLTFSNGSAADPDATYSATGGTLTVSGTWTINTAACQVAAAGKTLSVAASNWTTALTVNSGTLTLGTGTHTLNGAVTHTVAAGATLSLAATGAAAATIEFTAAATLVVNGTISSTWTSGPKPTVTDSGALARANLDLLGATIDVTGMSFANGTANGLEIGQNAGADATVLELRNVAFSGMALNGRHLKVTASGAFDMVAVDCSFTALNGASAANVQADQNGGAGELVVTMVRATGAGSGQEVAEGNPTGSTDDDNPGGPSAAASRDGYVDWVGGGDMLTRSPGTGEVRTDPSTHTGLQGFMTSHYDWYTGAFVSNYAIVRSNEDSIAPSGPGFEEDLLFALDATGKKRSYGPFRVRRDLYGRVIGPPWTVTIDVGNNEPDPDADTDVICFITTLGYIFVVEDTGGALVPYGTYPLRARDRVTYATEVCDTGYSPLLYYTGSDFTAETGADAEEGFFFCGANAGSNQIYFVRAFESGKEAQCQDVPSAWPVPYGGRPSRSWPSLQFLGGTTYLHIATDNDVDPDDAVATNTGHIFRVNVSTGAVDQEYAPGAEPGNHVRGGMQMLDDPALANDARIYVGSYEDAVAGDQGSFFAIKTDSAGPGTYVDDWAPAALGTGDTDSYASFDDAQIYLGDSAGDFYCMVRTTGLAPAGWPAGGKQTLEAGQPIRSSPLIPVYGGGPIYVGNDNGKVFRVNRTTGAIERTYRLGDGRRVRSLSIVDDLGAGKQYVVAVTSDGYAFLINPP